MDLASLVKLKGIPRKAKRIGRGIGSGKGGHTSSRGQKGQKSRSGHNIPTGFEGGQVPMFRRMPKRKGFVNSHKIQREVVNLSVFEQFTDGAKVSPKDLVSKGIIKKVPQQGVKILGGGELSKSITFEGFVFSQNALSKLSKLSKQK